MFTFDNITDDKSNIEEDCQSEPLDFSRKSDTDESEGLDLTKVKTEDNFDFKKRLSDYAGFGGQSCSNGSVSSVGSSHVAALSLDSPAQVITVFKVSKMSSSD